MSEPEKGGAAAFIAGVEKTVTDMQAEARAYMDASVDAMLVILRARLAEIVVDPRFVKIVRDDGRGYEVSEAAIQDLLGQTATALGKMFGAKDRPIQAVGQAASMVGQLVADYTLDEIASRHMQGNA